MVVAPSRDLLECWSGHLFRAKECPVCGQEARYCKRKTREEAFETIDARQAKIKEKYRETARKHAEGYQKTLWKLDHSVLRPLFEKHLETFHRRLLSETTGFTSKQIDRVLHTNQKIQATEKMVEKLERFTGLKRGEFAEKRS